MYMRVNIATTLRASAKSNQGGIETIDAQRFAPSLERCLRGKIEPRWD
jgi:hypothetical protein